MTLIDVNGILSLVRLCTNLVTATHEHNMQLLEWPFDMFIFSLALLLFCIHTVE